MQRTDEGDRLPMAMGHSPRAALSAWRTSPAHVSGRRSLVEKHHAAHVETGSLGGSGCPRLRDVSPVLLGGLERLFLSVSPNHLSVFHILARLTRTSCSASTHWHNCASVCSGTATKHLEPKGNVTPLLSSAPAPHRARSPRSSWSPRESSPRPPAPDHVDPARRPALDAIL